VRPFRLAVLVVCLGGLLYGGWALATSRPLLEVLAIDEVMAGTDWTALIRVRDMSDGDTVQVVAFHGLSRIEETIQLGTGGIAEWTIAPQKLTQSGTTLVVFQYGELQTRFYLSVLAEQPASMQAFTTDNSIRAYGLDQTEIISMVADRFGNPIKHAKIVVELMNPIGERQIYFSNVSNGFGAIAVQSYGKPGTLRLNVMTEGVEQRLLLPQHPTEPHFITLTLEPDCILNDGLERIELHATVLDLLHNAVIDGTILTIRWANGYGTPLTVGGKAVLRLPAPQAVGEYGYLATIGEIQTSATLRVADQNCSE